MDDIESQMAASGHLRRLAHVAVEQFQRGEALAGIEPRSKGALARRG
jgi:hypothetical protein